MCCKTCSPPRAECTCLYSRSASIQIRCTACTVSSGNCPDAVSAESITASVPSSTAFATSETSARVGIGLEIIDSIICVAVMTNLFCARAMRIMRFCRPGTAASPTSTPKSPRATIIPSLDSMISSRLVMASARSILAIILADPPAFLISDFASSTSAADFGKEIAI